jgi:peptidoglycan/xylan/chitin deacetylase (PgdA/CDA1 family)
MTLKLLASAFLLALSSTASPALAGPSIAEDSHAAVIFAYHRIGEDENPASSIRLEQFNAHINELVEGEYTVKKLDDIIAAFKSGADLPTRTVALTFDGGHVSFLEHAAPVLEQHKLPYTIFIVPGRTEDKTTRTIGWNDLRKLEKSGLATIGLHPAAYARLANAPEGEIRAQINTAKTLYREKLGHEPTLFAYPFGEYSKTYRNIIEASGFSAAFGQQSGVAYNGADRFALPRFAMTERYGDTERFQTLIGALPFPVTGIEPADAMINKDNPLIGFTTSDALSGSLKNLSCYVSGQQKPTIETIGSRIELRLHDPVIQDRIRINCTLPGPQGAPEDLPVWRWFGLLLSVPENRDTTMVGDEEDEEPEEQPQQAHGSVENPAP